MKMNTRQWMVTHEWMVKPMPQTEWIERRGILLWISEVLSGLGAGLFLVSLFMNNQPGMAIGLFIIICLKLPVHIAYFGKPLRFWRTMPPFSNAWKTSWSARGVVFTMLFTGFALVQLVIGQPAIGGLLGSAATPLYWISGGIAGIFALLTCIYSGFIMNSCKSVPFWSTGTLPFVFALTGIAEGFGLIMAIGLAGGNVNMASAEMWSRVTLMANALIIVIYMINASYNSAVGKISVKELITGKVAVVFWVGLIAMGIVLPLGISISSIYAGGEVSSMMQITAIVCHAIGAFSLKYCLLKVGLYQPLTPRVPAVTNAQPQVAYGSRNILITPSVGKQSSWQE
jgi:formate-dependent nitrite reductase membrane component NrfD